MGVCMSSNSIVMTDAQPRTPTPALPLRVKGREPSGRRTLVVQYFMQRLISSLDSDADWLYTHHSKTKEPRMAEQQGETESCRLITVRLTISTHRALRIRVAEEDTSIQQWVERLIQRELGLLQPADAEPKG